MLGRQDGSVSTGSKGEYIWVRVGVKGICSGLLLCFRLLFIIHDGTELPTLNVDVIPIHLVLYHTSIVDAKLESCTVTPKQSAAHQQTRKKEIHALPVAGDGPSGTREKKSSIDGIGVCRHGQQ